LDITVDLCLHLDQLRVHIIRAGFGHRRQRVRRYPSPARYANIYTLFDRFRTQIFAPLPGAYVGVDWAWKRVDPKSPVSTNYYWTQVTFLIFICQNKLSA